MHKLSSKKSVLVVSTALLACGIGHFATQADNRVYVDSDVSVSSAIERYIASNDDISAIEVADEKSADVDKSKDKVSTVTDATASDATATDAQETEVTENEPAIKYPEYEGKAVVVTSDNVNIRAAGDAEADVIGLISSGGVMNVMDKGEEWSLIASGDVIGYINNELIAFGDEGAEYAYNNVYKVAVVTTTTLRVRTEPSTESECVTLIPYGERYTLLDHSDGWVYIEIDDTLSGYVSDEYIDIVPASIYARPITEYAEPSEEVDDIEEQSAEDNQEAQNDGEQYIEEQEEGQEEGQYTDDQSDEEQYTEQQDSYEEDTEQTTEATTEQTTEAVQVDDADSYSSAGADVANFAVQFVGNPYVYGGSSLTNGADCSGFTMAVYANFGVSLPHGATMQSNCTTEVSLSDLQPGDLVYYDHGTGSIEHVGLYIGGGQIVHASTETTGIIISSVNYSTPYKATRPLN